MPDLGYVLQEIGPRVADAQAERERQILPWSYMLEATEIDLQFLLTYAASISPYLEDLVKTAADRLREEGLAEGRATLLEHLLEHRFGSLPRNLKSELRGARGADIERWAEAVLVAWASGPQITVFDIARRAVVSTFEHTDGHLLGLTFHPGGEILASTSAGKVGVQARDARLWDVRSGEHLRTLPWSGGYVFAVAFRPDGRLLAVGGEGGVTLWERREE